MSRPCSCVTRNEECEKHFVQKVKDWAERNGWLVYHTHDSRHSPSGFPDLVLVRDGVLIFWEAKRDNGKPTPTQQAWLDALAAVTGPLRVDVIRPDDWDQIERALRRITRVPPEAGQRVWDEEPAS